MTVAAAEAANITTFFRHRGRHRGRGRVVSFKVRERFRYFAKSFYFVRLERIVFRA